MSVHGTSHISEEEFEKQREAASKKIKGINTKVAKKITEEKAIEKDETSQIKVMTARKIFSESIDMFEDGDMKWDEMVKDLIATLKEI